MPDSNVIPNGMCWVIHNIELTGNRRSQSKNEQKAKVARNAKQQQQQHKNNIRTAG